MKRDLRKSVANLKLKRALEQAAQFHKELDRLLESVEAANSHYEVLGVERSATIEDIRRAHERAVTLLHPSHQPAGLRITDQLMARIDGALNKIELAFTNLTHLEKRADYDALLDHRPRPERLELCMAASVIGYDQDGGKWHEIARTVEVSRTGILIRTRRRVRIGSVLQLTLPLPVEFRRYGHAEPTYDVFALVTKTNRVPNHGTLVELAFLGARPPVGYLRRPWATFYSSTLELQPE